MSNLEHYAFPGGYAILYTDGNGDTFCPDCAEEESQDEFLPFEPIPFIHWEGDATYCDSCYKELPSEYGPIEDD